MLLLLIWEDYSQSQAIRLYNIPDAPDFSQYKYALIHCKQYNHLFGSAELR